MLNAYRLPIQESTRYARPRSIRLPGRRQVIAIVAFLSQSAIGTGQVPSLDKSTLQVPLKVSDRQAPPKVSVRVAPSKDPRVNALAVAEFDRFFESSERVLESAAHAEALAEDQCGRSDEAWLTRFRARNNIPRSKDAIPAGTTVILAPCPFWRLGGTVTIDPGETVSGELLRTMGQAGPRILEKVADLNKRPVDTLDRVGRGKTLALPFITSRTSHTLRLEFQSKRDAVLKAFMKLPGATSAPPRREVSLTLVGESAADCDASDASSDPIDAARVADVLEGNARVNHSVRKVTVAIIDTGIDSSEDRLSLSRAPDGTIGANMDPRTKGQFPTTAPTYRWRAHGTHVAGLVLGGLQSERLNSIVRSRIELKIINIVSRDVTVDRSTGEQHEDFSIPLTNLLQAIDYARNDPPIPILNLSVETNEYIGTTLTLMRDGDYLAVVAAGNDHADIDFNPVYPAGFKKDLPHRFLTVAAHKNNNDLAAFSNWGPLGVVDIAAPGCGVNSIVPGGRDTMTGTSQAAPLVTFTAALLYSEGLTLKEVRNRIQVSASIKAFTPEDTPDSIGSLRNSVGTSGRLDVERSLRIYDDIVSVRNQPEPLKGRFLLDGCITLAGTCVDLKRIGRLMADFDQGKPSGMVWLYDGNGELLRKRTKMPSGTLKFQKYGSASAEDVSWDSVTDILFAARRQQ